VILAAVILGGGAAFAAEDIVLRTSVTPEEAWIGQRVLLNMEVLGAEGWAQITKMGELAVPGAYVMRTESQGVRLNETIRGTSYTGQRYQLSVYCQRPGRMEIPGVPVIVNVRQWGLNAAETPHQMTTPAAALVCRVPPGAEGIQGLISTNRLDARQTWSARPETASTGDAITRTVTLTAVDISGMAFPPMRHPEIEGVGIYPGKPSVSDSGDRGSLRGERVEKITYVVEQPGEVALPAIELPWWDIDDEVLRRIELPGLELAVEGELPPKPVVEDETVPAEGRRDNVLLMAVVVALVVLSLWLGRGLAGPIHRWWTARRESEPAYFREMMSALRGGDPGAISAAVMSWLDRLDTGNRPARLDLFLRDHGDDATRAAATKLARCLANGESFIEARTLAEGLESARRHWQKAGRRERVAAGVLPELNAPREKR
jgi:hypothetical protein